MPRSPYLPPGTLREVLAYPLKVDDFRAHAFTDALDRVGLTGLAPMLDLSQRWDRELSEEEQQSLVFARLLIQAPRWVLIDEVLDSTDEESRARALDIFARELKDTAVIYISRGTDRDLMFTRVLHLIKDPTIRRLSRGKAADMPAPTPGMQAALNP
jgi:putative ATP-binding cassette transporter